MCGITGFVDFKRTSSQDILSAMVQSLQHRGPDGGGEFLWEEENYQVGLGHRRLSIIDLNEAASQPMHYRNFSLIFNGEIYNYNELRNELITKGHSFQTHSDTEVILHAFEEWGICSLDRFIGMFAFVLFDSTKETVYCIRDRVGVKPFFYYWDGSIFIFGSELKSISLHPGFKKQLDFDSVGSFLQFGYVPAPHGIFMHSFKLLPGHYAELDLKVRSFKNIQYWNVYDYYNKTKLSISLPEAIDETEVILERAFNYRMIADVPVGVFLSGGYDSTCVTALLQKNRTEKLKTFTIGMTKAGMDEAPHAKKISAYLGTDHTEYYCTEREALDIVPTLPTYYDEPFADSSAIPTMLVSKIAKQSVAVALSADAGDEVFAGYTRYRMMPKYSNTLKKIPGFFKHSAADLLNLIDPTAFPFLGKKYSFVNNYRKITKFLKNSDIHEILLGGSQQFYGENLESLFTFGIKQQPTAFDSKELKKEFFEEILYLMAMDFQTFLPDDILQKVDRATMSVSLEGREPLLDHHIIEWAAQLPTTYKYNHGQTKYVLKQIVHRYVPKELMDRPKMGFSIPIGDWLAGELSDMLQYYLGEQFLRKQGIFHLDKMVKIKNAFLKGRTERAEKVWCLLMFQMWYERWMF